MPFTKIDLAPVLDPLFDKAKKELDALEKAPSMGASRGGAAPAKPAVTKLKADYLARAAKEINRQGQIYTKEETAYAKLLKGMHEEGKKLSATVIDLTRKLQQGWNDEFFDEMKAKATTIAEMHKELHEEAAAATAHQPWRGNQPWDFAKAIAVVDQAGQNQLFALFKSHRDPMVTAMADSKTLIVKVDEFKARSLDCVKTAAAFKVRAAIDATKFADEVKGLLVDSIKQAKEIGGLASNQEKQLQTFVVQCNTVKTKLPDNDVKAAEQINKGKAIWLKNAKTELKTIGVKIENARARAPRASTPQQLTLIQGSLAEADKNLLAAKKAFDSLGAMIDIHTKKITEAKARK
jgi:hypothetical protein